MNRTIFIVFIWISIASCGQHLNKLVQDNDCITDNPEYKPAEIPKNNNYSFVIHKDASLSLFPNGEQVMPQIDNGNNLVFEYFYKKPVNPMMTDAGYEERILFEINPQSDNFLLNGSELDSAKAVYGNLCFCIDGGYHPITGGCIRGKKTGKNEWQIDMNIKAFGRSREFSKMLSEKFSVAE